MSTLTLPAPIRRLDGETVYERRDLRVVIDQIIRPDGSAGEYVMVRRGVKYGVTIIPAALVDGELKIAMIRQHRYPVDDYTLELPGGGATAICPEDALKELVEETGMSTGSIELLGTFYQAPGSIDITAPPGSPISLPAPWNCTTSKASPGRSPNGTPSRRFGAS
jgi:hypothetical protein